MSLHRNKMRLFIALVTFGFFGASRADGDPPPSTERSEDGHTHGHDDRYGLHFSHPIIAESPSPDTKARFDYFFRRIHDSEEKGRQHTLRFEGEYAFHPTFSVEVDAPFTFLDLEGESSESNFDNVEVGLKAANFAFAEHGLLLGYGLEFGLPTGDDGKGIGTNNELEIEPFFDVGFKCHKLELVGFASFGLPTNQGEDEEVENEFGFNVSALYHITEQFMGLIELDGETALNGEEEGDTVVNLTPGVKFRPFETPDLQIGIGASFPITGREEFEVQSVLAVFYHF